MHYILYAFLPIVIYKTVCLIILVLQCWNGFLAFLPYVHAFSCIVLSRYTLSYVVISLYCLLSLSPQSIFPWHLKRAPPFVILSLMLLLFLPPFLILFGSMTRTAEKRENFTLHRPHVERQIILSKLSNTAIPKTFQSRGLEFLCE